MTIEILKDGTKIWYKDGKLHRDDDLPSIEYGDDGLLAGAKCWHQHGLLHRIGGPAMIQLDGISSWYENGLLHRIDGPAIEMNGIAIEWWYKGKKFNCDSIENFHKLINIYERGLMVFI